MYNRNTLQLKEAWGKGGGQASVSVGKTLEAGVSVIHSGLASVLTSRFTTARTYILNMRSKE